MLSTACSATLPLAATERAAALNPPTIGPPAPDRNAAMQPVDVASALWKLCDTLGTVSDTGPWPK